jgi:homoserine dehydrogenase
VRDPARARDVSLPPGVLHADAARAIEDPQVDAVVEVIGGTTLARRHVLAALEAGKDVVTANKALLCQHGDEVFSLAKRRGKTVCFEAAVAGGVPVIAGVGQSLAANQVTGIEAILNGTSNYILTQMAATGRPFDDVVREAQQLGYAEADPTMDIDGTDAAQKLAILVRLAFGTKVLPEEFVRQGVDTLEAADLAYAGELGYAVKLLAVAKLVSGRLELHVEPTLVRSDRPIAQVGGPRNMIAVEGDAVGTVLWSGAGAGRMATASAVVSDIIDLAAGRAQATFPRLDLWNDGPAVPLLPVEEVRRRYYLRFNVEDRPHVVADIADILGRHEISLASIIQHEAPEEDEEADASGRPIVPLVVMTHRTREGQLRAAEAELERLSALRLPWVRMPVAD